LSRPKRTTPSNRRLASSHTGAIAFAFGDESIYRRSTSIYLLDMEWQ
jgi:hypothetical protein